MGLQIVTGYTGTAHIKSAHDRARNAGTVGTGSYVMRTGNMLAAKMQSANTLRIVDGDLMMQGVHATVEAGTHEDLTIDNGTQGKKRNDLVVARYERLAGEPKTESVTLRVIKGEPSDGAAADPAHTEGDILGGDLVAEMPLYRVPIDGITPGEPVALFETVPTIAELRDSVSPRALSSKKLQSGGSLDIPSLGEWLVIGAFVSMAATDNSDKEVMVPCYVGDRFVSGSSGCAVGSTVRYVAVKMLVSGTTLKYDSCVVQDMVSGGTMRDKRGINGIVGLVRR